MRKRTLIAAAALAAGTLALASCSGGSGGGDATGGTDGGGDAPVATLRIGTNVDPTHPYVRCGWDTWTESLDGLFDVQIFPSNQLGSNTEMIESIMGGNLEMTTVGSSEIAQFYPRVGVLEAPYLFDDYAHAQRALKSEEGQQLTEDLLATTGLRTIGMWYYGDRHFTTSDFPVRTPEDLEGKKIRTPDNAVYLAAVGAMGASATPVAFSELYLALSSGVVDGQENPISTIAAQGFDEVQGFISLTGHVVSTGLSVVNDDWYQGLSDEQRDALMAAEEEATVAVEECINAEQEEKLAEWEESGALTVVDDVDREQFAELVEGVLPAEFDESSDWGGLYETLRELRN